MLSLEEYSKNKDLMVVAHRGSSGTAPENSLSAYKEAIAGGATMIEVDVQITKDNQLIAYHDFYPIGLDKKISELNYDEIKDIDIGSGFDDTFKNEKIPLLSEVLELINGKSYLMVEIKTNNGEKFSENCNLLIELIEKYNYCDFTIFGSFNYLTLAKIKKINPKINTAVIKIPGDKSLPSELKKITGCSAYICSIEEFTSEISNDAIDNDIFTGVYSVETKYHLETALNLGCRAIATNYPNKIIRLLNEIKAQS